MCDNIKYFANNFLIFKKGKEKLLFRYLFDSQITSSRFLWGDCWQGWNTISKNEFEGVISWSNYSNTQNELSK